MPITSGHPEADHFEDVLGMVEIGSGAKRQVTDIRLPRYACYLIVQNGDQASAFMIEQRSVSDVAS